MPLFVVVTLTGDIGDAVFLEVPVFAQQGGKRLRGRDARHHPKRVAEEVAMLLRGKRVAAFRAVAGNQVEEAPHIVLMHEVADLGVSRDGMMVDFLVAGPGAEELAEVERLAFKVLFRETVKFRAEVVRVEIEARQGGVGIGFVGMFFVPRLLPLLLHHVVPDENRILVVLREDIERRSRKREDFRVLLDEMLADFLAKVGLSPLVRLVDDHEVPIHVEYAAVLVVLAVHDLRAAQVLDGREVDETLARFVEAGEFAVVPRLHLVVELVCSAAKRALAVERIAVHLLEELVEILLPAATHHRTVRDDDDAAELALRLADDLKRGQRLAEAHLRVPQHFDLLLEAGQRLFHGGDLLFAEFNGVFRLKLTARDNGSAVLDRRNCGLDGFQVCAKPLAALRRADELVRQTGVLQDGMNLLVGEVFKHLRSVAKGSVADGELGVQQLVFDAGSLGLLVDARTGRVVQCLAVRRKLVGGKRRNDIRIANLEIAFMLLVVYGIDIDQLVLERLDKRLPFKRRNVWLVVYHRLPPLEVLRGAEYLPASGGGRARSAMASSMAARSRCNSRLSSSTVGRCR